MKTTRQLTELLYTYQIWTKVQNENFEKNNLRN
jgi:hypothetical protein